MTSTPMMVPMIPRFMNPSPRRAPGCRLKPRLSPATYPQIRVLKPALAVRDGSGQVLQRPLGGLPDVFRRIAVEVVPAGAGLCLVSHAHGIFVPTRQVSYSAHVVRLVTLVDQTNEAHTDATVMLRPAVTSSRTVAFNSAALGSRARRTVLGPADGLTGVVRRRRRSAQDPWQPARSGADRLRHRLPDLLGHPQHGEGTRGRQPAAGERRPAQGDVSEAAGEMADRLREPAQQAAASVQAAATDAVATVKDEGAGAATTSRARSATPPARSRTPPRPDRTPNRAGGPGCPPLRARRRTSSRMTHRNRLNPTVFPRVAGGFSVRQADLGLNGPWWSKSAAPTSERSRAHGHCHRSFSPAHIPVSRPDVSTGAGSPALPCQSGPFGLRCKESTGHHARRHPWSKSAAHRPR